MDRPGTAGTAGSIRPGTAASALTATSRRSNRNDARRPGTAGTADTFGGSTLYTGHSYGSGGSRRSKKRQRDALVPPPPPTAAPTNARTVEAAIEKMRARRRAAFEHSMSSTSAGGVSVLSMAQDRSGRATATLFYPESTCEAARRRPPSYGTSRPACRVRSRTPTTPASGSARSGQRTALGARYVLRVGRTGRGSARRTWKNARR